MNILTPINDIKRIDTLIDAGADEFFFGFYNDCDMEHFGRYFELNRMSGFQRYANSFTYESAVELVKEIGKTGKDSYVTLNSSGYTEEALRYLEKYVAGLIEAGATGIIVSCPEMMEVVRRNGGHSVVSCVGTAYNEADIRFYRDLGATRVIVPRDLTMDEIVSLMRAVPEMEYETFIMRNGCILSDGNCLGLHQFEHGGICQNVRKSQKTLFCTNEEEKRMLEKTHELYDKCLFRHACAACAIYQMVKANITACKMVGRVDKPEQVIKDMKFIRANRDIAMQCNSEAEYFEKMLRPDDAEEICPKGYSCYFPEIVNPLLRHED